MKKTGKTWFFVVLALILALTYCSFFGISAQNGDMQTKYIKGASDIRFGIDIRGGVDVTFVPNLTPDEMSKIGHDKMVQDIQSAKTVIEMRLVGLNITDYEMYTDENNYRIILRFPWKVGETQFNPEEAIQEIATTAKLTFHEGFENTEDSLILEGANVVNATSGVMNENGKTQNVVSLTLDEEGAKAFAEATTRLAGSGYISIFMDDTSISRASVRTAITDGEAIISGNFEAADAKKLASQINSGALPFALSAESYSTISPTLGSNSLQVMVEAGIVAFILIAMFMTLVYRLPGFIASIALLGQMAATIAMISGFLPIVNSFTLTLPGIAGIILSIGMGVDANVITAERISEELRRGKTLDGAIKAGFKNGLSPIIDGNVTVLIVAALLMGAFGPTDGLFAKVFSPVFFAFGPSTAGTIYSFGYTLMVGVLLNFVFGVGATRVMLRGISKFKAFRNPWLYGAKKNAQQPQQGAEASDGTRGKKWNIVGNRKVFFIISAVLIACILLYSCIFGVQLDIQFRGGAIVTYAYTDTVDEAELSSIAQSVLGKGAQVQLGTNSVTGKNSFTVSMPGSQTITTEMLEAFNTQLAATYPNQNIEQLEMNNVNPTIGGEFFAKSIVAVLTAFVLILLYIAVRFRKIGGWPAGCMALVALVHDLLIIFGIFVVLGIPLNGNFIAAVLTILGYSINDTVVIYDRIRENGALQEKKGSFADMVNHSINQSKRRTINTTLTTLAALGCVCIFSLIYGMSSILTFAFPLMIGMVSGVYSSLCLSGSLWVSWVNHKEKKKIKA